MKGAWPVLLCFLLLSVQRTINIVVLCHPIRQCPNDEAQSMPDHARADQNLLFGILALQMDFISRDALVAAMNAWVLDKTKPLSRLLLEQQALGIDEHDLLEALVHKHLQKHDSDLHKSL